MIEQQKKKVGISFNAGGIRGYFSALIVQQLERDIGLPLNQFVDVFSGVSIGCILSTLYAIGVSSDEIVNMFETKGDSIFKPKFYYKWGLIPIKGPRYCSQSLQELLYQYLQDKTLKDVNATLIGLTTDITDSQYPFCTVFSNISDEYNNIKLIDMTLASSAAPSYFQQHEINNRYYIDGGLSNCDPSLQCISGLSLQTTNVLKDSILINIGTGIYQGTHVHDNASKWNEYYLLNGINASLSACQSLTSFTASQLYQQSSNLFILDTILSSNIELDDLTSLPQLKQLANEVIQSNIYKECINTIKNNLSSIKEQLGYDINNKQSENQVCQFYDSRDYS